MNINPRTRMLIINSLAVALVFVATVFINIKLPFAGNGGLVHLGNVPLFIFAILFGRKTGFIAGAFGMALFDLMGGWVAWAPFTFLIVGAMGYTVGLISESYSSKPYLVNLLAMIAALVIKIVGYYVAEVILYGNFLVPLGSIPGNVLQISVAIVIVLPIATRLKELLNKNGIITKEAAKC